jgi:molybdopterin molybdotransferase
VTARFDDVRMRGFRSRADVADVVAWIDARPAPVPAEDVALAHAAGRVLAQAVASAIDVPAFPRASMDGFAVRGADTFGATEVEPLSLRLVGTSKPGTLPTDRVEPGTAIRIMTGAPMPDGADAVLPAESAQESGGTVVVRGEVPPGRHVGLVGEDVKRGDVVLAAGRRLRPQDVGLLASIGAGSVSVVRRPRVAIVSTGDELLAAGTRPSGAKIPDANGPMLEALAARDGGDVVSRVLLGDDERAIERALLDGDADVLLASGASSVGPEDRIPSLVAKHGDLVFHGVAMRPSSPTGLGTIAGRVVVLLPGNPVSCLCAYDAFAGRLLRRLGGLFAESPYAVARLPLARKIASEPGRVDYVRVRIVDGRVEPLTARGSAVLSTTTRADGFVWVPKDLEGYAEGTEVDVHLYDRGTS